MLDYLKIFPEFETMLRRYTDEERGRLFMAMMAYAYRGEEPDFAEDAHEWYIWDTIKLKIDQCAETLESKRASGKKGGSAKQTEADASKANQSEAEESKAKHIEADASTPKQTQAEASKAKQTEADASKANQSEAEESKAKHIEADASTPKQTQAEASKAKQTEADASETDIYKNKNKNKSSSSYVPPTPYDDIDDDELLRLRQEQQDVETAARRVGLPVSAAGDYDTMDNLRAEHGADNLLKAISRIQGATEKSRDWRYISGILRKERASGYTWADKPPTGGMSYGRSVPKSHERDL